LYLLAFFIFLISETFSTTMFQLPGSAYTLCKAVACLLLIIKVFRFDEFSRKTFFIFVLLILETILVYVNSGYMEVFFWDECEKCFIKENIEGISDRYDQYCAFSFLRIHVAGDRKSAVYQR